MLILATKGRETGTLVWEAIREWHLAQVVLLPDLLGLEAVGWGTQAEKCELRFKLKQRGLPWGSRGRRCACVQLHLVSLSGRGRRESWRSETAL